MQIALTGDVMLGRMVDQEVIRNQSLRPEALWGDVLPILLAADLRVINLECVISARGREWHPQSKAFHFRAHPRAIDCLKSASIDAVTLANNHVLDYGAEALLDCLGLLDQAGITHAGAGRNLAAAMEPAFLPVARDVVAVLALTDNEPDWEAADVKPGVVYVAYARRGLKEPYRARVAEAINEPGVKPVSSWSAPTSDPTGVRRRLRCGRWLVSCLIWGPISIGGIPITLLKGSNSTVGRRFCIRAAISSTTIWWMRMNATICRSCSSLTWSRAVSRTFGSIPFALSIAA
jgi:hypothetical protein